MFNIQKSEFTEIPIEKLIIQSERVAHVQVGNSLEHALLVLTKSGYSAIPVLSPSYNLQGLISTPIIMDSILGLERIEFEQLEKRKVEEVMLREIPRVSIDSTFRTCLTLLIDHPFLCVVDQNGVFAGILTRRTILNEISEVFNI